jgi:hypothetical protein
MPVGKIVIGKMSLHQFNHLVCIKTLNNLYCRIGTTTFNLTTLSIVTLSLTTKQCTLSIMTFSITTQKTVMPSVANKPVMLIVVMQNFVRLNVVAPLNLALLAFFPLTLFD